MTRTTRIILRQVVTAAALAIMVAAPAAHAQLAVQHDSTVVTDTAGNNNGVPEPGDTLSMTENVMSVDPDQTYTGVSGTLTSSSPDVTIGAGSSAYPDLAFAAVAGNTTPFSVSLSSSMECGVALPFDLTMQTDQGPTDVPFTLPTGSAGTPVAYNSTDVPAGIPDNDASGVNSSLTVGGTGGRAKNVVVRIGQITHPYDADLTIYLVAPDGRSVMLVSNRGGSGQNFTNTVFSDSATKSITSTTAAPFTGTFRPAEPLSAMDGAPLAGTWNLRVVDSSPGSFGSVDAWGADIAPAVCAPQPSQDPPPPPPPPPTGPHDCGLHEGDGHAYGLAKHPRATPRDCPDHGDRVRDDLRRR